MNWFGKLLQKEISDNDTVLDLGCGIFQAYTNVLETMATQRLSARTVLRTLVSEPNLKCKSLLGCELVDKYIDVAKEYFPVIKFDITNLENYKMFADKSFDVVMAIDVLEHIDFTTASTIILHMKRIARKKVIIYTPSKFETNSENIENAWNLGSNPYQEHKSFIDQEFLKMIGFQRITYPKPDKNTFAIWENK